MKTVKITYQDGELIEGREELRKAFDGLAGEYAVTIEKWEDRRSGQANRLYWLWLGIIGDDIGMHKNELHEALIDKFSPIATYKDLQGKPVQKRLRTSAMKKSQFNEYMNQIEIFARAELGIDLPEDE